MQIILHLALLNKYCEDNNMENPYKIFSGNPFMTFISFVKNLCNKKSNI
jgi:hypothetical protein